MPIFRGKRERRFLPPETDTDEMPPLPVPVEGPLNPHDIEGTMFADGQDEHESAGDLPGNYDATEHLIEDPPKGPGNPLGWLDDILVTRTDQLPGRSLTIPAWDGTSTVPTELLTIRSDDKLNSMFSVSIGQDPEANPALNPFSPAFGNFQVGVQSCIAIIEYGAGATQFTAAVDIVPGQVFTVGGSFLRILIFNFAMDNAGVFIPIRVGAFVSLLPKGAGRSARFTQAVPAIAAAGTVAFLAPVFGDTVEFQRAPANAPYTLSFEDQIGTVRSAVAFAATERGEPIAIPGNTSRVRITNGAVPITSGTLVFRMSL